MAADSQHIPLMLGAAGTEAERRSTPEVYERNINVKVIRRDPGRIQVLASFLDLDHSFDAEMIVEVASGRIEHAKVHMAKRPFQMLCLRALDNIPRLVGEVIGRGIYRRITDLIGKSEGCVHLAEIFQAALATIDARPEESLYVGDVYSVDYVGARNAGMDAVLLDVAGAYRDRDLPRVESLQQLESWLQEQP